VGFMRKEHNRLVVEAKDKHTTIRTPSLHQ
jgi:hypothetical protein